MSKCHQPTINVRSLGVISHRPLRSCHGCEKPNMLGLTPSGRLDARHRHMHSSDKVAPSPCDLESQKHSLI